MRSARTISSFLIIIAIITACAAPISTNQNSSSSSSNSTSSDTSTDYGATTIIAEGLDTPWGLAFLPDKSIFVTERPGRVRLINSSGQLESNPVATLSQVKEISEGGLLGLELHPNFGANHYVYVYYTYSSNGNNTRNRVSRFTYENQTLTSEQIIVDAIPGAANHNGGRIKFGPDGYLYIGTGDAGDPSQAQNLNSLAGKILRTTESGNAVTGNPFNNLVYSYGHRNVQGLTWDNLGQLWATEHGRSGITSGYDELNLVLAGENYGWPTIQGDDSQNGMQTPKKHSGSSTTWAPSGIAAIGNTLYFTGLRGQTLYRATIQNEQVANFTEHYQSQYGRLRDVIVGPDNQLYISTSNRDGRGNPVDSDDRIIRIDPQ